MGSCVQEGHAANVSRDERTVAPVHPKPTPVILTNQEVVETWPTAPWVEATALQHVIPDEVLAIVEAPKKIAA